jgi:alanyl-tRNA synthetase
MTREELINKFKKFFEDKGHAWIPSAPLIPEGDTSTLFISAGIHPLVPYFIGEKHPMGNRLANVQECLRTGDIDQVGDTYHHTWFEMLGNWSLGNYFKKESITWSWEFLTKELKMDPDRLAVTIFEGNENAPFDEESKEVWLAVGMPEEKIFPLGKNHNWWEVGETGPGGPDTEIFYDTGKESCNKNCQPGCDCGKWIEIWNNVFIEYNRKENGSYEKLGQKNVDTGMGLARMVAVLNGHYDDYRIRPLEKIIKVIEALSNERYGEDEDIDREMRIIADHLRAAVFVLGEEVVPSNKKQGYILRRLIRRAVRFGKLLSIERKITSYIGKEVINIYQDGYHKLSSNRQFILENIVKEEEKFWRVLDRGLNLLKKELKEIDQNGSLSGMVAFDLYQSYGFPLEITIEEVERLRPDVKVDVDGFKKELSDHKEKSRRAAKDIFKGGLAEQKKETIQLHTATHLLHQALKEVLGDHVYQAGSAITEEKLRFDFPHSESLSDDQLKRLENLVNKKIEQDLPVVQKNVTLEEAKEEGASVIPGKEYPDEVKVYEIKGFSKEVCGGPHVNRTGELGKFKIIKEESSGAGKRRIYAQLRAKG